MTITPATDNVVGAILFWAYIGAALSFTALIVNDLITLYVQSHNVKTTKSRSIQEIASRRDRAQVFLGFSLLSFTLLSYSMLSFLIESYTAWADVQKVELPGSFFGAHGIFDLRERKFGLEPWRWSRASTLFQDFAHVICDDPRRFWWTHQALLYSFGWNVFMSIQGVRHQVPHLWAYFVLDQILPVSFTQNLFCTAILLIQHQPSDRTIVPATSLRQRTLLCAYMLSLWAAPNLIGTGYFLLGLFCTRALLFAPLLLLAPNALPNGMSYQGRESESFFDQKILAAILGSVTYAVQSWQAAPLSDAVKSLHDSPAVATLGYDYLVAVGCLLYFVATDR